MDTSTTPTDVLAELRSGAPESLDQIVELAYQELRHLGVALNWIELMPAENSYLNAVGKP